MKFLRIAYPLILPLVAITGCGDDGDTDTDADRIDASSIDADARTAEDAATGTDAQAAAVEVVPCSSVTPDETVNMQDLQYVPDTIAISAGDVVQWENLDEVDHTVTSGRNDDPAAGELFDSGFLGNGETFCLRFDASDSFEYYCRTHPLTMEGTVTVE